MLKLSSNLVLLLTLLWWQASPAADLAEVYRLALRNDAQLMIAESDYLAAIQGLPVAESRRLPQVSFNAIGQTREADNSETGSNSSDNLGYGLNLTQSLYDTETQGDVKVAKANSAAALARLKSIRQDLILRVADSYFGILAAEDNVEFAYAERNAIARQLEQAQKRFEVGLIAITDVQEAQASFDNSEAQVILAENIRENAFQSLVVLTADPSIQKLTPLGENLKLSLPNPATVESWVLLALNNNLDLLAAQHSLNAARYERDKETRNGYPTVDLVATYEDNDRSNELLGDSRQDDLTVGIELLIPLYTGGRLTAERAESASRYVSAQNTVLLQNRLASQQSRIAYLDVVSGISGVKALKQALASSNLALKATQAGFEVGTRTSVDVLISLRETYRTQRDYASSRYQYLLNKLRLSQAAGILTEDDLLKVNNSLTP
ncbi:MAG: TolC family outer membrane protein [Gammaproteobacteria bacterium]|nr:TolC family outer membrane protein [Gammaproteobacteria bacterium]